MGSVATKVVSLGQTPVLLVRVSKAGGSARRAPKGRDTLNFGASGASEANARPRLQANR
jgi:hypothetical protein